MTYKNIKTAEEVEAWELQPLTELPPNVIEWGSPLSDSHDKPDRHTFAYIELNGMKRRLYYDQWLVKFSDGSYSVYGQEHFKSKFYKVNELDSLFPDFFKPNESLLYDVIKDGPEGTIYGDGVTLETPEGKVFYPNSIKRTTSEDY